MQTRTRLEWQWRNPGNDVIKLSRLAIPEKLCDTCGMWEEYSDHENYRHLNAVAEFTPTQLAEFLAGGVKALSKA